jgi:hypothetical protein
VLLNCNRVRLVGAEITLQSLLEEADEIQRAAVGARQYAIELRFGFLAAPPTAGLGGLFAK